MKKFYALAAAAVFPLLASARPASPELMSHTNPDGTIVEFHAFGDGDFNYMTDADRQTILRLNSDGFMVPCVLNGRTLRPVAEDIEALREQQLKSLPASARQARMAALDYNGRSQYPTTGEVHGLVVLLEFSDTPYSMEDPQKQYDRFCNEEGYSDFEGKGSARDYFIASSRGKFQPHFDVVGPVKLKHNSRYYSGNDDPSLYNSGHNARFGVAIQEALEYLDPIIDFSKYDLDNNQEIDNIFFFYSGYGQADNTNNKDLIWPHQWDYLGFTKDGGNSLGLPRLYVDGVEMRTYACTNELNGNKQIPASMRPYLDGIGAFCHEYGHVLGLPDLYDTLKTNTVTPGNYSIMDTGSYNCNSTCPPLFSAYEQWVCNWLEYDEAEDATTYTLPPLGNNDAKAVRIRIRRPASTVQYYPEYFVLENRNQSGWDYYLPQHGMFIWHIDYDKSAWTSNRVNISGRARVELISSPGDASVIGWPGDDNQFPYILPSQDVLVSRSTRKTLDVTISSITYDPYLSPDLTFDYNNAVQLTGAPVLSDSPTIGKGVRELYLNWTKVEGATDYALTVTRRDAAGRTFTVSSLNETLVGNVDHFTVRNISAAAWTQVFTAYVRAFNGLPATTTSNKVMFVPADLNENTGVDEISGEIPFICGGVGCIYAPEGAKVYNLNGIETGLTDLPAGIYIVVAKGATAKVAVR